MKLGQKELDIIKVHLNNIFEYPTSTYDVIFNHYPEMVREMVLEYLESEGYDREVVKQYGIPVQDIMFHNEVTIEHWLALISDINDMDDRSEIIYDYTDLTKSHIEGIVSSNTEYLSLEVIPTYDVDEYYERYVSIEKLVREIKDIIHNDELKHEIEHGEFREYFEDALQHELNRNGFDRPIPFNQLSYKLTVKLSDTPYYISERLLLNKPKSYNNIDQYIQDRLMHDLIEYVVIDIDLYSIPSDFE